MQVKIQKYGGFALAIALAAGSGDEAISANLLGSTKGAVMGGGIPTILKDEAQSLSDGVKVEIEGIVTAPDADRK